MAEPGPALEAGPGDSVKLGQPSPAPLQPDVVGQPPGVLVYKADPGSDCESDRVGL